MVFEQIIPYLNLFRVFVIIGILVLMFVAFGILFIIKSMKINHEKTISFIHNIMAGITGGIVVAILLDFKEIGNWISYVIALGVIIFVIGIITYSNMLFYKSKGGKSKVAKTKKKIMLFQNIKTKFTNIFNLPRFFKAFVFAVTVGLGAYLGKFFFQMHWFWALVWVTLIMMVIGGKVLDVLFNGIKYGGGKKWGEKTNNI